VTTSGLDLGSLVRGDRVHRRVYADPAVFDLEMTRIFGRAWIYIGHESQVRRAGDYYATRVGREPVVLVRGDDGRVRVLHNRCAHRGALVVADERGHTTDFRCAYHGWTYRTDGSLLAVPLPQGYAATPTADPALGLQPVARSASYRGFVFASLAADGPDLGTFLGPVASSFDDMVERAPDDTLEVAGGVFKHAYDGNWKLYLENLNDGVHPNAVHQSSIEAARAQDDSVATDGAGEIAVRQMRQNGAAYGFWEKEVGLFTFPFGHSYLSDYHTDEKLVVAKRDPVFADYIDALERAKGRARAQAILGVGRWNTNLYPNCSFMSQFRQLRVVHPIAVDRTEVHTFNFRMRAAPARLFHDTIRFANVVNGTGSPVLTDDLETYGRIQAGLQARGPEWINAARQFARERPDDAGGHVSDGTSEAHIRNMFAAWVRYMAG
jgi:phenylpropionate dioxygenase-like ring-hydroxylating dioxygenase large terminal subunit